MAQLVAAFNPQQVDPTQGSASLPVGKHKVVIVSSEVKPTSDNANGYLQLNLEIIDGEMRGIGGAYRLNLYHQKPDVCKIAERDLSAICHVTNQLGTLQDSAQLHNIPFIVEVGLQKDPEKAAKGYTEVKKVYDVNGNEPKAGSQGSAQNAVQNAGSPPNNNGAWGGGNQGGFNTASNVPPPQDNQNQQGNGQSWGQANNQQQNNNGAAWGNNQNQQQQGGNQPSWGGNQGGGQPSWGR